jgi:hypothetical protein
MHVQQRHLIAVHEHLAKEEFYSKRDREKPLKKQVVGVSTTTQSPLHKSEFKKVIFCDESNYLSMVAYCLFNNLQYIGPVWINLILNLCKTTYANK